MDDAIDARPGRVTVHIWSSVRSVRDCETRVSIEFHALGKCADVGWSHDVVAIVTTEAFSFRQ